MLTTVNVAIVIVADSLMQYQANFVIADCVILAAGGSIARLIS